MVLFFYFIESELNELVVADFIVTFVKAIYDLTLIGYNIDIDFGFAKLIIEDKKYKNIFNNDLNELINSKFSNYSDVKIKFLINKAKKRYSSCF
jgi:hypothetical protein